MKEGVNENESKEYGDFRERSKVEGKEENMRNEEEVNEEGKKVQGSDRKQSRGGRKKGEIV